MIYALLNGVNFRPQDARDIVAGMDEGHELTLTREPGNPYDSNAIKVIDPSTELHLGYVEKDVAAYLASRLDTGEEFTCEMYAREGTVKVRLAIDSLDDESEDDEEDLGGDEEEVGGNEPNA